MRGPWRQGKPEFGYQLPLSPEHFFKAGVAAADAARRKISARTSPNCHPAMPNSHVLGVNHDRASKRVRSVRYIDLLSGEEFEQPADVVVLASFTMSNTKLLLMAGIGQPYDPQTGMRRQEFLPPDHVRRACVLQG
jgi:hypothetical protein